MHHVHIFGLKVQSSISVLQGLNVTALEEENK